MMWHKNCISVCRNLKMCYHLTISTDIEAPTFETCPSVIIRGTDVGNPKGKLIWKEPTLTDNSGQPITAIQSPKSVKLGSYQSAGTYTITYSAEDAEGNHARDCVFKVIIRGKIYPYSVYHVIQEK